MIRVVGNDIELTRGDSLLLRISLQGRDLPQGTQAVFTLKKHPGDTQPLLQKRFDASVEEVTVALSAMETDLPPRTYCWDLRLRIPAQAGDAEIYTPMEYATLTLLEAVGSSAEVLSDGADHSA